MLEIARRFLLLACLAALAALLCAPTAGAASRFVKTSAHFVYINNNTDGNCGWGIGIRISAVRGAESYLVKYYDGYWKRLITSSLTPQQGSTSDPTAPKGSLFLGVTGGTYSPPCSNEAGDPAGGGRFSKGATAQAVFKKPVYKVSGTVVRGCPGRCGRRPALAGVTISAVRKGGGSASAVTGTDGKYQLAIPRKGDWTFTPRGLGLRYKPRSTKLPISADKTGVNFSGCGGSASASVFGAPARAAALTPGTYSNKLNPATDTTCSYYNVFFATAEANGDVNATWQINPIGKTGFSYEFALKTPGPGSYPLKSRRGTAELTLTIADPPTSFSVTGAQADRKVGNNVDSVSVTGPVALVKP